MNRMEMRGKRSCVVQIIILCSRNTVKQEEKVTVLETEKNALKIEGEFLDLKVK